jgi:phenylpropionate dioxygenase-like ring-hydroxylating dioxygenase large terminal subunit
MDAFCPHLGAHLGLGSIVDNTVRCAFHGWRFGVHGDCAEAPGQQRNPTRAKVRRWPVTEFLGQVLVWYHPEGKDPDWQVAQMSEPAGHGWTGFRVDHRWPRIRTHVQEFVENGFDLTHLKVLHDQLISSGQSREIEIDGQTIRHRTWQTFKSYRVAGLFMPDIAGPLDFEVQGLGIGCARATVHAKIDLQYALVLFLTPLDEEHIEVTSMTSVKKLPYPLVTRLLQRQVTNATKEAIEQDIPIWESKLYRARPILGKDERPITEFRRWAEQFYHQEPAAACNARPRPPRSSWESASKSPCSDGSEVGLVAESSVAQPA